MSESWWIMNCDRYTIDKWCFFIHTLHFGEPVWLIVVLRCTQSCVEKHQNQHQPVECHRFYCFSAGSPNAAVPPPQCATENEHKYTKKDVTFCNFTLDSTKMLLQFTAVSQTTKYTVNRTSFWNYIDKNNDWHTILVQYSHLPIYYNKNFVPQLLVDLKFVYVKFFLWIPLVYRSIHKAYVVLFLYISMLK